MCLCTVFRRRLSFERDEWRCTSSYLSSFLSTCAFYSDRGTGAGKYIDFRSCTWKGARRSFCKQRSSIICSSLVCAVTRALRGQIRSLVLSIRCRKLFLPTKICKVLFLLLPSTCLRPVQLKLPGWSMAINSLGRNPRQSRTLNLHWDPNLRFACSQKPEKLSSSCILFRQTNRISGVRRSLLFNNRIYCRSKKQDLFGMNYIITASLVFTPLPAFS